VSRLISFSSAIQSTASALTTFISSIMRAYDLYHGALFTVSGPTTLISHLFNLT